MVTDASRNRWVFRGGAVGAKMRAGDLGAWVMDRYAIDAADRARLADRLLAVVVVLVTNAIPIYGVLHLHWSVANVLVLFWIENLLIALATCAGVAVHRRTTRKQGHRRAGQLGDAPSDRLGSGSLLHDYASIAVLFTLAHGVFVAAALYAQAGDPKWHLSLSALRNATALLVAVLATGFASDLPALRRRSFALLRSQVRRRLGRVFVLHVSIVVGALTLAAVESAPAFLYVLIGIKTMWELALACAPESTPAPRLPDPHRLDAARVLAWSAALDAARRRDGEDEQASA
jgi:hypothetical protein